MKEVTVTVTKYETEDGKVFDTKEQALNYEKKKELKKFKELENMPFSLPLFVGESLQLMDSGYHWYRVESKEEEDQLLSSFKNAYGTLHKKYKTEEDVTPYPKTLGVNTFKHTVVSMECLNEVFDKLKRDYESWFNKVR